MMVYHRAGDDRQHYVEQIYGVGQ